MVESRTHLRAEPLGIGERLRNAREAKGLSLRAVADVTRIRTIYLEALEEERFDQLPGAVYARGFLRTYADALGLDPDRLMDSYPGAFEPPGPPQIGMTGAEIPIQPAAHRSRLRIVATYVAAIFAVGLVIIGVIGYLQLRQFNQPVPPEAAAPAPQPATSPPSKQGPQLTPPAGTPVPAPAPAAPSQFPSEPGRPSAAAPEPPAQPPQPEPPQPAVIDGVSLEVRTEGTSWLRVTADGERVFQGLLHEGETRTWQAKRRLTIRVGNSPVVQVAVNGRRVPGPVGKRVWEQTFTKPQ
jgi:cytoskeletal protein RodZ